MRLDLWLLTNHFQRSLTGDLSRWALTIQEFRPEIKYVTGRANSVADALSRNTGAVIADPLPVENFSLQQSAVAQREHDVWKAVIYALESGDETSLPPLPVPFSQFSVSGQGSLQVLALKTPPGGAICNP